MPEFPSGATRLDIVYFDPLRASRAEWDRLHAYRRMRHEEDYPGEPSVPDSEFEHSLRKGLPLVEWRRFLALRDGNVVGNLVLEIRRQDTPHYEEHAAFVFAGGGVPRALRRQGIATALLGALHGFMRAHGKTVATMKSLLPEGHAFIAAAGAEPRFQTVENRMPFEGLDWDELARWQAQAARFEPDLAWEIHAGRAPFERLAQLIQPFTELINQQPLGTLDMPRIRYEMKSYAQWYAEMDRRGGEHFLVMLRQGDALVAVCDASWDARFPDRVYQQLTAVVEPWRGKGLAKAVKAAMLRLVRERHPAVRTMVTTNADANAPMLSINRRLGFAVHRREVSYQIGVDQLGDVLSRRAHD